MNNKSTMYGVVSVEAYNTLPPLASLLSRVPIQVDPDTLEELPRPSTIKEAVELARGLLARPVVVSLGDVHSPTEGEEATDVIITIPLCGAKIHREADALIQAMGLGHEVLFTHQQVTQFLKDGIFPTY